MLGRLWIKPWIKQQRIPVCAACCMCVRVVLHRDYYDDPAHASELQGVDKDKYVAGGPADDTHSLLYRL